LFLGFAFSRAIRSFTSSVRPRSRALQKEEERKPANEHVIFHGKDKMEHRNTDVPFYSG